MSAAAFGPTLVAGPAQQCRTVPLPLLLSLAGVGAVLGGGEGGREGISWAEGGSAGGHAGLGRGVELGCNLKLSN